MTNLIKQQLAAGQGSAVDVLQSQLELLELENALNQNQGQMASAVAQLRRFVGDDATMHLSGDVPAWPLSYQEVQQHLKHHPDLLLAHANVVEEEAKVAAAVAEQHPDWGLGLSYQHSGPSFADMVSLTVSMSLPIFPSHRQGPKLSAERSRLRAAQDELIDIQRQHAAQLQSDWTSLQALTAQIDRLHDQELPLAQQKIDLLVGNYRAGKSEINTLLVARSERRQLLLRLIDQQAQRDRLAARLHYQYQYSVREMTP